MEKLLVIVFDNENQARAGCRVLRDLHAGGYVTVYAAAILSKDAGGQVSVNEVVSESPLKVVSSPIIGNLVGLLGGSVGTLFGVGLLTAPLGAIFGALGGSVVTAMLDFVKAGGREDFVNDVTEALQPGKAALVAEVNEEQVAPVDARMEAAGGLVFRQPVTSTEYLLLERDLTTLSTEIADLKAECTQATGEARAKLQDRITAATAKLQEKLELAHAMAEAARRMADAKIQSFEAQEAAVDGAHQEILRERAARVRSDYNERISRLERACSLTQEALAA